MAWLELHQSIRQHRKTYALAETLGIPTVHAGGHLCWMWLWAIDNSTPDGVLSKVTPAILARAADWPGDPQVWFQGLLDAEFLERYEDGLRLHNWGDYVGKYVQRVTEAGERMRALRQAQNVQGAVTPRSQSVRKVFAERSTNALRTNYEHRENKLERSQIVPGRVDKRREQNKLPPIVPLLGGHAKAQKLLPSLPINQTSPVKELMKRFELRLGYVPRPYGAQAKAAKSMLADGYTEDDVMGCWESLKRDPFWAVKSLSLVVVQREIGEWVRLGKPVATGSLRPSPAAPDVAAQWDAVRHVAESTTQAKAAREAPR